MRFAVSFLFLALAAAPWAAPAAAQSYAQPRLKAQVVVAGDIVRVGDMIENAGLAADKPIFRAPDLGQTGAVPARAVLDAVRPFGLIAAQRAYEMNAKVITATDQMLQSTSQMLR